MHRHLTENTDNILEDRHRDIGTSGRNGYDMICMFDNTGQIVHASGNGWDVLGLNAGDLILMNVTELFQLKEDDLYRGPATPFKIESKRSLIDSDLYFEHVIMPAVANDEFYCMSKNVTHEKLLLRQLNEKVRLLADKVTLLEQRDLNKNKVLSVLSHDLRNPISSIAALANLIENGDIESDLKGAVHDMKERLDAANDVITDMLEWASRSFSAAQRVSTEVNIAASAKKCIANAKQTATEKQVTIIDSLPDELYVAVDTDHMNIVIRNLLQNAVKFTPANGTVSISGAATAGHVSLIIADTGIGMSEVQLANMFTDPSSSRGTKGEKGSGMGLLMCKEYIEANNGTIHIESKVNAGTRVTITFAR